MKKMIATTALLLSFTSSANLSEGLLGNARIRTFLDAASRVEFCGARCYKTSTGQNVMISDMSCEELDDLSISLNEDLTEHESRLQEIRDTFEKPFYKKLFVNEDALKFEGYVLNTDLIPRVKNRSLRVHEAFERNCAE